MAKILCEGDDKRERFSIIKEFNAILGLAWLMFSETDYAEDERLAGQEPFN